MIVLLIAIPLMIIFWDDVKGIFINTGTDVSIEKVKEDRKEENKEKDKEDKDHKKDKKDKKNKPDKEEEKDEKNKPLSGAQTNIDWETGFILTATSETTC